MASIKRAIELSRKIGRVTIEYPYVSITVPERFRGRVDVDLEKCIGCGACASFCPAGAIVWYSSVEGITLEFHFNKCIFCGLCIENCPEKALKFSHEFELASRTREDQIVRVVFKSIKCEVCGKYFMTERQYERVKDQVSKLGIGEETLRICPECRRKLVSKLVYLAQPK